MFRCNWPEAVLLTGVYGVGKSTVAADLADVLDHAAVPSAAMDLDWLSWTNVTTPGRRGELDMMLANLATIVANYRAAGARYFVLAGTVLDSEEVADVGHAMDMPLRTVELVLPLEEIARRLANDPTEARQRDLAQSRNWIRENVAAGIADLSLTNGGTVRQATTKILEWLGWLPSRRDV